MCWWYQCWDTGPQLTRHSMMRIWNCKEKHHRQLSNWPLEVTGHRTAASVTVVRQVTVYTDSDYRTLPHADTCSTQSLGHLAIKSITYSISLYYPIFWPSKSLKRTKLSESRNVKVTVWISTTLLALVSCHPMRRGGGGLDLDTNHQTFHQIENTWYLCHPVRRVSLGDF